MSEIAYSNQLKRKITRKEAERLFKDGTLMDIRDFKCSNPECNAPMTCKALHSASITTHFILSHPKDQPHIFRCPEASEQEIRDRVIEENDVINKILQSGTIVALSAPKKKKQITHKLSEPGSSPETPIYGGSKEKKPIKKIIKNENSGTQSLDVIVGLFLNPNIDNQQFYKISFPFEERKNFNSKNILFTHGKCSLNRLFYPLDNALPINSFHIFYGDVYLELESKTLIKIIFAHCPSLVLYTNKDKLLGLSERDIIHSALLNHTSLRLYCEGMITPFIDRDASLGLKLYTVTEKIYESLLFRLE